MIVTVTPNTGLDQTLFIPSFVLNRTIRASQSYLGIGSKGADASWVLGKWGVPSLALGFAAGPVGHMMVEMLHGRGVETDFTWVNGSTRWNVIVVYEDGSGQSTITSPTLQVSPEHLVDFQERFERRLPSTTCLVLAGTTPPGVPAGFYPSLIQQARAAGVPVILDSSGETLRLGLETGPALVKPNQPELEELLGEKAGSLEEVYRLAFKLHERYAVNVVATLGSAGAYAVFEDAHYWLPAPQVRPVSTAGAGDAVIAGLAEALSKRQPLVEGLRLGFALATASLLTPVTADFDLEAAHRFYDEIEIVRLPDET
jgi:1-phosphofructokinase family hexose kinase